MTPMVLLNEKFKAPSKTDVAQWEIVKMLVDNGFRFQALYDHTSAKSEFLELILRPVFFG